MTKEITKAKIMQELQDKFGLREFEAARFLFDETVIPTYDIGAHLKNWEVMVKTVSITSATSFTFFTVPYTERWLMRGYFFIFGMPGAIKSSGMFLTRGASGYIYLDLLKGQEVSYVVNLPAPVVLEPGNQLAVLIDTYVSTQSLTVHIDVQREEIR